jgi:hypothetical protein
MTPLIECRGEGVGAVSGKACIRRTAIRYICQNGDDRLGIYAFSWVADEISRFSEVESTGLKTRRYTVARVKSMTNRYFTSLARRRL